MSLTALQYRDTEEWLHSCGIHTFIIRPDGKVDVLSDAYLFGTGQALLDTQFSTISGTFDVSETSIASISNFPEIVHGNLLCHRTNIISLSGIDRIVKCVHGRIHVNHNATHLLGLLLIKGVTELDTGEVKRDAILKKYLGSGDIISAQDELLDAGYNWSARL